MTKIRLGGVIVMIQKSHKNQTKVTKMLMGDKSFSGEFLPNKAITYHNHSITFCPPLKIVAKLKVAN